VKNDKLNAPDGISITDRLESLVKITAKDIKACSNMCDAYMKKRLLAKVLSGAIWNARLLEFANRFAQRRQKFEFELTVHITQSVDKANLKLDAIQNGMKAMFERLSFIVVIY
jgi:pantothenate kinase-related protein Tda10